MSAYRTYQTTFTNQEALAAAITAAGYRIVTNADGNLVFAGQGLRGQVAMRRQANGTFSAGLDSDNVEYVDTGEDVLSKLRPSYAEADLMASAKTKGYTFVGRKVLENKDVQLLFEK